MAKKYKPEQINDNSIFPKNTFYKIPGFDNYAISKKGEVLLLNDVKSKRKNTLYTFNNLTKDIELSVVPNNSRYNRKVRIVRLLCLTFNGPVVGTKDHAIYLDETLTNLEISKLKWVSKQEIAKNYLEPGAMQTPIYYYNVYKDIHGKAQTIADLSEIVNRVPSTIITCLKKEIPYLTNGFLISKDKKVNWLSLYNKLIGRN